MASKMKAALAQLAAASQGQKRTDQYVVQESSKIVEEVTEEEYRAIVSKRREEFVEGDHNSEYQDSGKEIWDDPAAKQRAARDEAERAAEKRATKAKDLPPAPPASRAALLNAFQAGGSASPMGPDAITVGAGAQQETRTKRDMDLMLAQMCNDIEADDDTMGVAEPLPKRKLDAAASSGSRAKRPAVAAKKEASAPLVAVKKEPKEPRREVQRPLPEPRVSFSGASIADEVAPESETPSVVKQEDVKVKLEVKLEEAEPTTPEPEGASNSDWLQTSDVKMEDATEAPAGSSRGKPMLEEDGSCWFFFIDAFEDERSSPPRVFLFGKILASDQSGGSSHQSCCLVVEGIERCLHLLLNVDPDDEEAARSMAVEAESEFDAMCSQHCPRVKKLRAKLKHRNYAFEKALPNGHGHLPFLKVLCDCGGSVPPVGFCGRTFSHMFGAQTSLLERLMLTRRINGPSWLRLQPGMWMEDPARFSFCSVELRVGPKSFDTPKSEEDRKKMSERMPSASPLLRVMSVSMQTFQESSQKPHEAVAIGCTMHPNVSPDASESDQELRTGMTRWAGLRRLDSRPFPRDSERVLAESKVSACGSETALILAFLGKVQDFDPDVIVGHNAFGFDLDVLASRLHHLKIQPWQKLGRLRRPKDRVPRMEGRQGSGFWVGGNITVGRLVCDVLLQSRDLLPKLQSYDLPCLVKEQLSDSQVHIIEPEALPSYFETAQQLASMAHITISNALWIARLMQSLQILPLSRQLTNLAGNTWNASLQNKRAERNELLLCHEFHRKKFVLPDKESLLTKKRRLQIEGGASAVSGLDDPDDQEQAAGGTGPRRGKAQYSGGLVLEPKVGLYEDFVMLLDFNSLYPSIIQEHNICFTTVERPNEKRLEQVQGETELLALTHIPDGTVGEGVLPQVLRRLVESRRTVKTLMKSEKDPRRLQVLEIRQKALKLTANSMYGCLGFQNSRFYAKPLAAMITAKGREALQSTINVVNQELNLEVVYGDTDSVFINTKTTDYDQAMNAAQLIKRSVNKRYKRLEIEIDAVFYRLMLLKKKKYAAMKVIDWPTRKMEPELKGLDIVRRDWCKLAKSIGQDILMKILKQESNGKEEVVHWIHQFLTEKAAEMDELRVPLEAYIVTKGLTKDPKDYPDAKTQPHVQVALRLIARGKPVRAGQEVEYVICEVESAGSKCLLADKARHPHELTLDPTLKLDIAWYKKQQVHPLVSRLLVCVDGTDAARIADCLGMDSIRFAQSAAAKANASELGNDNLFEGLGADVSALFDRGKKWQDFPSSLAGVNCSQCQQTSSWRQLLLPAQVPDASEQASTFCCHACKAAVHPRRAQNLLVLQLRKLLKEHCEGWVQCPDDSSAVEKTRRLNRGHNMVTERSVLRELEHVLYLSGVASDKLEDESAREAALYLQRTASRLLDHNGNNWVDCGHIFGSVFGNAA